MTEKLGKELGDTLKRVRGRVDRREFATMLGVHPNTLALYERSERVPEVDFLATFAEKTGTQFSDLLRLRLAVGATEEARRLAGEIETINENREIKDAASQYIDDDARRSMNEKAIYIAEWLLEESDRELNLNQKARYISGAIATFQKMSEKQREKPQPFFTQLLDMIAGSRRQSSTKRHTP